MNKKTKRLGIAFLGLILVLGLVYAGAKNLGDDTDKTIQVIIKDDGKTLYDEKVDTNAKVLKDLLLEMEEDGKIVLEYEDSTYGMYITGMGKDKLHKEDAAAQKYWTYSSENNRSCQEASFCDSAEKLVIEDENIFVFTLMSFNE